MDCKAHSSSTLGSLTVFPLTSEMSNLLPKGARVPKYPTHHKKKKKRCSPKPENAPQTRVGGEADTQSPPKAEFRRGPGWELCAARWKVPVLTAKSQVMQYSSWCDRWGMWGMNPGCPLKGNHKGCTRVTPPFPAEHQQVEKAM